MKKPQESQREREGREKEIPRAKEAHVAVVKVTRDEIMSCLLRDKAEPNDENAQRNRYN